jgi:aminoglycoside phosphotransferase (APT) family kinase protein
MPTPLQNIVKNFLNTEGGTFTTTTLKSGHINDTFKVEITQANGVSAAYILQQINTYIFPEPLKIMENIETVATHLKAKNYPKPILSCLKTKQGAYFYQDTPPSVSEQKEGVWRMLPFIDNTYSVLKADTENQAYEGAKAFGEYLKYLNDLDISKIHTIIPNFHNAAFRVKQFKEAFKKNQSAHADRFQNAHNELIFMEKHIRYFSQNLKNIPQRVTHNDTKISNLLFDINTHKAACIIDLDTLQPSTILSDFGDMVRTYTPAYGEEEADFSKIEVRPAYYQALSEGFLSEIGTVLTDFEKEKLVFGAKRTIYVQALRFLTDYLNHDIYYKTTYPEQNLVRTRNQIALLKSM